jgi:hypothetical protein
MAELAGDSWATVEVVPVNEVLEKLSPNARTWVESLSWQQRGYVLSLCHLICAAPSEIQADFLGAYTTDGLAAKKLDDQENKHRVKQYLEEFRIHVDLSEAGLKGYIKQFYVHSAQDTRRQPNLYLDSALKLVLNSAERSNLFSYILGFELLKMMFCMSWHQHEKLYRLQRNQEEFHSTYIKPIQYAHRLNGIIVPKDKGVFFAKRHYFVQEPSIAPKKLVELVMATFTAEVTSSFGFTIIRHPNSLAFDYDYIFQPEADQPEADALFCSLSGEL